MSLYQLQKLIYHVNRDAAQRESYRRDPSAFVKSTNCPSKSRRRC